MTIKLCFRRNLFNKDVLCNIVLYIIFFTGFACLHRFTNLKPQDVLPLFFFPVFHFILLGIMLYLLMSRACKNKRRRPALLFLTFVMYATIAGWGFNSSGMRSKVTLREDFKEEIQM